MTTPLIALKKVRTGEEAQLIATGSVDEQGHMIMRRVSRAYSAGDLMAIKDPARAKYLLDVGAARRPDPMVDFELLRAHGIAVAPPTLEQVQAPKPKAVTRTFAAPDPIEPSPRLSGYAPDDGQEVFPPATRKSPHR